LTRHLLPLLITLLLPASVAAQATVEVPPVAVTRADQQLVLSSATFDAPLVDGLSAGDTVTLTTTQGTVTLASLGGLSLSSGTGIDDVTVAFTGSPADVNAALDGLSFDPTPGFAGTATLQIEVTGAMPASATLFVAVNDLLDGEAARDALLLGVTSVHSGVQPGRMVAFGSEAYAVAWFPGGAAEGPMIGAASWGAGRVVAVPDHQMLDMGSYGADSGTFYVNGLAWLADSAALDISIVTYDSGVASWLTGQGYTDVVVSSEANLAIDLPGADVFVPPWLGSGEPDANMDLVADFVTAGGGLFLAEYGVGYVWWWGPDIPDAPGNLLLREAGLGFSDGHRWDSGTLDATGRATGQVNAEALLGMLASPSSYTADELVEGAALLDRIYDALQDDDPLALLLDDSFLSAINSINPTPATPVSDPFEQAMLLRELDILEAVDVADVVAHRTAEDVFGAIDVAAPRVTAVVPIDTSVTRWHTTCLYAAPGDLVTVTAPASVIAEGFGVRISGHVDNIAGRSSWARMPRVSRWFPLDATNVDIASPFGGAIYIDVGAALPSVSSFDVTIAGALEAPCFELGATTDADWIGGQRDLPAPFAELTSEHLSISLPSSFVDTVDEMTAVMEHWDDVVFLQDSLAGHGYLRTMAERINVDVQISVGWLHAGYPTQGPTAAGGELVDIDSLMTSGSWGWYHELGHEAQRRPDKSWGWDNPYTFDGAVEATVNIFTSHVYDEIGQPSRGGWSWTGSPQQVMQRALDATASGDFASVGVGDKLAMFLQLRDGWGWPAFTAVFDEYDSAATLPADVQEERDWWLTLFSDEVGHDLSLFMVDHWGLQASPTAVASLSALPPWLPALGTVEGLLRTAPDTPLLLDLEGTALSHDGVATVATGPVSDGLLVDNADGTWTWEPPMAWQGSASFDYTVTSSTSHASVHTVELEASSLGVLLERWTGVPGTAVSDLTSLAAYPASPDETEHVATFEAPPDFGDSYGSRLRGFLLVPQTGDYTFWLASDDGGELWISPDEDPSGAVLEASVPGWTGHEQWDKYASQESLPLSLVAGDTLYVEALMKEGGGLDHLSVAWEGPDVPFAILGEPDVRIWRASNAAPLASDDAGTTDVDLPVTLDVLANDSDADGDPLVVVSLGVPADGQVTDDGAGLLTYTPDTGWSGIDSFDYTVADGYGGLATATVEIEVLGPAGDDDDSAPVDDDDSAPVDDDDSAPVDDDDSAPIDDDDSAPVDDDDTAAADDDDVADDDDSSGGGADCDGCSAAASRPAGLLLLLPLIAGLRRSVRSV